MNNFRYLENLYTKGKIEEALRFISENYDGIKKMPEEVMKIKVLCLLHSREYNEAVRFILFMVKKNETEEGLKLLSKLADYVDDEYLLREVHKKMPKSIDVISAMAKKACNRDSKLCLDYITKIAIKMMNHKDIAKSAGIFIDTSRALILRGDKEDDMTIAINMLYGAIGKCENYQDEALAFFELSRAYEKKEQIEAAQDAALWSLDSWVKLLKTDPANKDYQEGAKKAQKRADELL